jgi:hypothetical protein
MVRRAAVFLISAIPCAVLACNAILGIESHQLAAVVSDDASSDGNVVPPPDSAEDGKPPDSAEGGKPPDSAEGGKPPDSAEGGKPPDSAEGGKPSVPPVVCGDSGVCVSGGIFSVGRTPDMAGGGIAALPGGGLVTLTDDGFEVGETLCKDAICVTGAITP